MGSGGVRRSLAAHGVDQRPRRPKQQAVLRGDRGRNGLRPDLVAERPQASARTTSMATDRVAIQGTKNAKDDAG